MTNDQVKEEIIRKKNFNRFRFFYIVGAIAVIIVAILMMVNVMTFCYESAKSLYNEADYAYLQQIYEETICTGLNTNEMNDTISISLKKNNAELVIEFENDETKNITRNFDSEQDYSSFTKHKVITCFFALTLILTMVLFTFFYVVFTRKKKKILGK